jgi:capsular exopolysaccharide synthesis family protein
MDDLPRLFARYRVLLLVCLVIGAGVAGGLAYSKGASYSASAGLQLQDITELEAFNGSSISPLNGIPNLGAVVIRTAKTDQVLARTAALLPTHPTVSDLRQQISASVDPASNLVMLTASEPTARRAAATANALAVVTTDATNAQSHAMFASYARKLAKQISTIPDTPANSATRQRDQQNLALLQTLSVVAVPVHIAQSADPPTSPVPRHTVFYLLLGAILGLAAGVVVAFAREAFDRKIRRPAQVTEHLGVPILAHLSDAAFGQRASLRREGSSDSVQVTLTQFGMLRSNVELMGQHSSPRIVAVTSPGPQEGKTTVAAELASSFARAGRHTVVVETDMRRPQLAARLGLGPEAGLSDYLRGDATLSEVLVTVDRSSPSAGDSDAKLACLTAGAPVLAPDELLARARLGELLQELAEQHEVVIIDVPPVLPVPDALEILPLVNAWLICVRAGQTTLPELDALRGILARLPAKPGGAVITGVSKREYRAVGYVAEGQYAALAS